MPRPPRHLLVLGVLLAAAPGHSASAAQSIATASAASTELVRPPELLVETERELLTVAWVDGVARIVAREDLADAAAAGRGLLPAGTAVDARRSRLYVLTDRGDLAVHVHDAARGELMLLRTWPLVTDLRPARSDLALLPGSSELAVTGRLGVRVLDLELGAARDHPRFGRVPRIESFDVEPLTHRIAFVQADEDRAGSQRVRFANPDGALELPGERALRARWRPVKPVDGVAGGPPRTAGDGVEDPRPPLACLAFGSCADEDEGTARAWRLLGALAPDAVVLLGDTPYIDSTEPAVQARRYREFAAFPPFADLARTTPMFATWDDHDFGRNDTDGRLPGKENSRAAFVAAHSVAPFSSASGGGPGAERRYGAEGEGIYSSFRHGPLEVFLLDTRWFAGTAPSEFDASQPTLLGAAQWSWLREGLRRSDAPFKLLACGMIWNGAVRPGKPDHWGAYPAEFDGLCRFVGEAGVTGVVLVGGDIHRSRVVEHDTRGTVGYSLTELISSPMHDRVIEAANAPHPGLRFDTGEGHVVCLVRATDQVLRATFQTPTAVLHEVELRVAALESPD